MTTLLTPFCYQLTIGVTSAQILPVNPSRKGLIFFNPSNANVSVCPAFNSAGGAAAAALNGAGSISVLSGGGMLVLPQAGWPESVGIGSAFNAIAAGANTPFTCWEF
jgi:hypothetical protein